MKKSPRSDESKEDEAKPVCAFFFSYEGVMSGGPKRSLDTALAAKKHGIEPILVSNVESPITQTAQTHGIRSVLIDVPSTLLQRGGKGLSLSPRSLWQVLSDVRRTRLVIDQIIRENKVDAWWSRGIKNTMIARSACAKQTIPLIWDIGTEYASRGVVTLIYLLAFSSCQGVVAQGRNVFSETFPAWLRKLFRRKCFVVMPGLDDDRVALLSEVKRGRYCRDKQICLIGTIHPRKNQLLLINACNALFARGYQFQVRFVGETGDVDYLRRCREATSPNQGNFDWQDWTSDVSGTLEDSSALAMTSLREGLPQVVLEALHAGRPVISVPVGAVPDLLSDGVSGFLSPAATTDALAQSVEAFLNSSDQDLQRIRENGARSVLRLANHRRWESDYADMLLNLMQQPRKR